MRPNKILLNGGGHDHIQGGDHLDAVILPISLGSIPQAGISVNLNGAVVTMLPSGSLTTNSVERLHFNGGHVLAFDVQQPVFGGSDGGSTGQVLALAYAAFGFFPSASALGHWVARADAHGNLNALAQEVLNALVPEGASNHDLVAYLFMRATGRVGRSDELSVFTDMIGDGRQFETQGSFFAAVAGLLNAPAELVGTAQVLEYPTIGS